ncbi:SRPBCC domain-containing protein [Luteolibacter ambystomatis]|uniref:SRPBCC domain-containing protein n=1 Tax=Luteolibacter ambystomatis TaxID=2824561 RepID=A0A975J126_9BACT|nr:SRPBCC domain-containing protein [Luteolibacter ambystomatis]QUE52037.1 SRPBCC domain-containing protein [Luteolibacter ambystomatis]
MSTSATTAPADRVLSIDRVFDAPRPLVYRAWTEKEHLDHWSAPHGFTIPFSEGELRVGGAWRSCMLAPDGTQHRLGGVYQELIEDRKIVFTHIWEEDYGPGPETIVTVLLSDEEDGRTRMQFSQGVFATVQSQEGHQGGWNECFERLDGRLTDMKLREVAISRFLDASAEDAFDAWADPGRLKAWWGPQGFTNPLCQFEAKPGGIILIHMRAPDGTVHPMSGVVQEVAPPDRLTFLSAALDAETKPLFELHNTITFTREGDGVRIKIHARLNGAPTPETLPYLSGMQTGWAQSMDRLQRHLEIY